MNLLVYLWCSLAGRCEDWDCTPLQSPTFLPCTWTLLEPGGTSSSFHLSLTQEAEQGLRSPTPVLCPTLSPNPFSFPSHNCFHPSQDLTSFSFHRLFIIRSLSPPQLLTSCPCPRWVLLFLSITPFTPPFSHLSIALPLWTQLFLFIPLKSGGLSERLCCWGIMCLVCDHVIVSWVDWGMQQRRDRLR